MSPRSAVKIPNGYASSEEGIAYIVGAGQKIHLLDLKNGESLAQTSFEAIPLLLDRKTLFAWHPDEAEGNKLHLFALVQDATQLKTLWESIVQLPGWVDTRSVEPDEFHLQARLKYDQLIISWEAHARYRGGAPPPKQIEVEARHDERHTLLLNCKTGELLEYGQAESIATPMEDLPSLYQDRQWAGYLQGSVRRTQPWQIDRGYALLIRGQKGSELTLIFQPSGLGIPGAEICLSHDPTAEAMVAEDGSVVFVHEPAAHPTEWRLYSTQTGELLDSQPYEAGTRGAALIDDCVLTLVVDQYEASQGWSLRCHQLQSKQLLWSTDLGKEVRGKAPALPP